MEGTQKGAVAAVQSKSSRGPTPIYRWRGLKDKIEKLLWVERQDLFNNLSMVFFDTTSLYFEGAGGQSLGQRGHSNDSRPDLAQMIVGLVLDGQGDPKANLVIMGDFNEGQPVGSRGQLSHSQLAKFTCWLPAGAALFVGFPEIGGGARPRLNSYQGLPRLWTQ